MKANPMIPCPACGHEMPLGKALAIEMATQYIGTGEYVGAIESVSLYCPACKVTTEIAYEENP